jgi:hypothetical protein
MPGFLLHVGATVTCAHGGQAMPTAPNPSVLVSGQPTALVTAPYTIAGCALPPPPTGTGPCGTAQWVTGTTRVTSNGQPLVVQSGSAVCVPTGTPVIPLVMQTRVMAT